MSCAQCAGGVGIGGSEHKRQPSTLYLLSLRAKGRAVLFRQHCASAAVDQDIEQEQADIHRHGLARNHATTHTGCTERMLEKETNRAG